jgi:hypothetical protein
MSSAYWQLIQLCPSGGCRNVEVEAAKTFFQQQFGNIISELDDLDIQRSLFQIFQDEQSAPIDRLAAEYCLRCYISCRIMKFCEQLAGRFGGKYGFERDDLLPLVLDDEIQSRRTLSSSVVQYSSLATGILKTFDSTKGSLNTWVFRQVRQAPLLCQFLLQHGVYMISDWAILNDTRPAQLQRVLNEFHHLTPMEIEQASALMEAYHRVYREDRLRSRSNASVGRRVECKEPSLEQERRMVQWLEENANLSLSGQRVMNGLLKIAMYMRQYRIRARGGKITTEPLPDFESADLDPSKSESFSAQESALSQMEHDEFLEQYRLSFQWCLDQAIEQIINERYESLDRKSSGKALHFLAALKLFHCQGMSMGEIASRVDLKKQYEVSRLMQLKEFRAAIRQRMLALLSQSTLDIAKTYTDPSQLKDLDRRIESALSEQIAEIMEQAGASAAVGRSNKIPSDLFSRRLCLHLDTRGI